MTFTAARRLICVASLAGGISAGLFLPSARAQAPAAEDNAARLSPKLSASNAADAWLELQQVTRHPPATPPEWKTTPPTRAEQIKFILPFILATADKAHDFYTRFSQDPNAMKARQQEYDLLGVAVQVGATNRQTRLDTLEKSLLADKNLPDDDRFKIRQHAVERAADQKSSEGNTAAMAEFEKGARALQKEFPNRPEVYQMLLEVASSSNADKAREIASEIVASTAPEEIKEQARSLVKKLESVGKPLALQFTAVDGRAVDLAKLKGKVVLVDFWATWCGPCVAELPHVKAAYDELHAKGFEIVGISLDQDKDKLTSFTAQHQMAWPQFCDAKGWENQYAQQFGVTSIPAMWLVDKTGKLRDINAREDLRGKVEKMLAE